MVTMAINSWLFSIAHTFLTFILSLGSYWTSLASKFQYHNATKGLEWLSTGYYTLPVADEMLYFSGMKTPLHLGVLVLEDTYCLASIALVISLGYSIGTRHFSVYARGLRQSDYLMLEKMIMQLLSKRSHGTAKVRVRHILEPSKELNGNTISAVETSPANVHIVDPGDGKKLLAELTKEVALHIKGGKVARDDITPAYIDKLLQSRVQCPDPDMVLKFGSVPSTCGYLPWQMRLTEIISVPSLHNFNLQKMKRALMAFSKINPRFGK
ncbi:dehydrodolichyl diphosphate synthase complex subunit nus1-like [Watersipora subatra]|uniref:dehydrodolichyl diphosphate synthase complex subunit nus1-like n=1 Tax=Watersipora subatra TaxID=2589382 RepID=UPI00355B19D5